MGGDTSDPTRETGVTVDDRAGPAAPPPRPSGPRYQLGDAIGRGGMGEVIAARDEQIGREVAIKRILAAEPSDRSVARFLREAQIQGRLEHPAIPPVHELGRDDRGLPYFVMKKLAGTTLSAILGGERGPDHTRQRLLRAFAEVCLAIEFAHVNGVIHRDLKPANIMLGAFGEVYVLDWGVAKVRGEADSFEDITGDGLATHAGAVIGTPGYMAPEQAQGLADIDHRADVYALGRVLGEILAVDPDPAPELLALHERAIAVDRGARTATARILADSVHAFLEGDRNLALRQELAREHLDRARTALAGGSTAEARKEAIGAAGKALALDASLHGPGELIAKLILEPVRESPREVIAELRSEREQWMRNFGRSIFIALAGYCVFLPSLFTSGGTPLLLVLGMMVMMGALGILTVRGRLLPVHLYTLAAGVQIGVMTALYSPMLIASVAVVIAMQMVLNPALRRRDVWLIGVVIVVSLLVPVMAGELGWVDRLMVVTSHGIEVTSFVGIETQPGFIVFTCAGIASLVGVAISLASRIRVAQVAATTQLQIQSWHLRQLLH